MAQAIIQRSESYITRQRHFSATTTSVTRAVSRPKLRVQRYSIFPERDQDPHAEPQSQTRKLQAATFIPTSSIPWSMSMPLPPQPPEATCHVRPSRCALSAIRCACAPAACSTLWTLAFVAVLRSALTIAPVRRTCVFFEDSALIGVLLLSWQWLVLRSPKN